MTCLRRILGGIGILVVLGGCVSNVPSDGRSARSAPKSPTETAASSADRSEPVVYRLDNELWIDDVALGIETTGPPRWRSGFPDQLTYVSHSRPERAGVFLFERIHLRNLTTGEDTILIDIEDHGWAEAGHPDWSISGTEMVFAARESDGRFVPHVFDLDTGEITRFETVVQIIDTVFAPDGQIMGVDTSRAAEQIEPVVWVSEDGRVEPIESSIGVNRDPAVSPDGRYVANIRASGPLARVFVGRWDLVITDLQTGVTRVVGDGADGFGPPRWIDEFTLIAKHGRYNRAGIVAAVPDVVTVHAGTGAVVPAPDLPLGAWDPDPLVSSRRN
jgi:hypothetical protein